MRVTLSDQARQYIGRFGELTGVTPVDCLINNHDGAGDRLVFLIPAGEMSDAIGPDGTTVKRAEERLGVEIQLVEDAATPEAFVANTLAPAAVRNVTISEAGSTVAYVEVPDRDRGIAIGNDGRTIEIARELASRHFEIDDVQLA